MMKTIHHFPVFIALLFLGNTLNAQVPFSWKFILDGYNDVYLADMVVDSTGNTYVGVNYTAKLQVPGLDKELPLANYVHGLIIKLDPHGKALWAHPFKSSFDNRINDLALAPNGDLLVTGFGDGLLCLPGLHDTLKLGKPEEHINFYIQRYQGLYAARYEPNGERKWARYFDAPFGEGVSIAANKRNEVWLSLYYLGTLKQGNMLIDSIPKGTNIDNRSCIAVLNGTNGKLQTIQKISEGAGTTPMATAKLEFDHEDNLLMYGIFSKRVNFTGTDSLINDSYYDGTDSYIAKLDQKGKLLWDKKISGQNAQMVKDIAVAEDNSIYATGSYSFECVIGDGVAVIQKSMYKYKSGESFFYLHLLADGELDFARYEEGKNYNSSLLGENIAIDQNGRTHICGYFTDTVMMDKRRLIASPNNSEGHYSLWKGRELQAFTSVGSSPSGFLDAWKIDINHGNMVLGGEYYGDKATLNTSKGKEALPNKDYGRVTFLVGGVIATEKEKIDQVRLIHPREIRQELIKTFDLCTDPVLPNVWLPEEDTLKKAAQSPCGQVVKGMEVTLFPNPTQGETKLKLSGIVGRVQLEVFSLTGQLLLSNNIEDAFDGQIVTLNLSNLANATYIVRVTHKGYQKGLKVIKQ